MLQRLIDVVQSDDQRTNTQDITMSVHESTGAKLHQTPLNPHVGMACLEKRKHPLG
jgi:hypothetical protein